MTWPRIASAILLAGAFLTGCAGAEHRPPSFSELGSLPDGIRVSHSPNPVRAQKGGPSKNNFSWLYTTTVSAVGGPVVIEQFGAFQFRNGHWRFSTVTGEPFTPSQFTDWYSCPDALIEVGSTCSDPQNWTGSDQLRADKSLWYFIGRDSVGNRVKGQATIEQLAELADATIWHTSENGVLAFSEIGGKGNRIAMPEEVELKLILQRGGWGIFEYTATDGGTGEGWILMDSVEPYK